MNLLKTEALEVHFIARKGVLRRREVARVRAVDGVSIALNAGEVLGLVGESGCGKSTLSRCIAGLAPRTAGRVLWEGRDLDAMPPEERRRVQLSIQMVFQDPFASLNPRMTVFDTLAEPFRVHAPASFAEIATSVRDLMNKVGLAGRFVRKYPHEFSGGQRQRIAIARALALSPRLLLADEPVSALDVSIQAQILNLLADLRREMGLAMLFISHDLAVVQHISDRVAVMQQGKVVEYGPVAEVIDHPAHPYTRALLASAPQFAVR